MDAEENRREEFRLSQEQQAEIGDILLSARAVSRQMIASAKQQAEELINNAREQAEQLTREAEEKAAETLRAADEKAAETLRAAGEQALETARAAEAQAAEILRAAREQAGIPASEAEEQSGEPDETPAETAAAGDAETPAPTLPEEMQEYVVRCVGDCFAALRRQQQETADFINEQWRAFLSGLSLPEIPAPGAARPVGDADSEVSRQEIEQRVSAIAKELMEIIGI